MQTAFVCLVSSVSKCNIIVSGGSDISAYVTRSVSNLPGCRLSLTESCSRSVDPSRSLSSSFDSSDYSGERRCGAEDTRTRQTVKYGYR